MVCTLNLKPEHIAHYFVGDQNRVEKSHNFLTALNFPLKEIQNPNGTVQRQEN
jgi:hypothetical protein